MSLPFPVNSVVCADWIEFLRKLPDESVQCSISSPPYWGLRNYDIPPSIWDGDPACEHRFEYGSRTNETNHTGKARWQHTRNGRDEEQPPEKRVGWLRETIEHGQFCRCGAWRGCLGLEPTPEMFVDHIVQGFRKLRRVLRKDGTLWLNLGDSYAANRSYQVPDGKWTDVGNSKASSVPSGMKPKDLCGIPWMVAFALRADGWYLRQDIIWSKPNPMPESVTDRCTKAHEYLFLLTKSQTYFCDMEAIKEPSSVNSHARGDGVNPKAKATGQNSRQLVDRDPAHLAAKPPKQNESFSGAVNELVDSRNKRSVWEIATAPFPEAHFATFPPKLVEPCILAGTSERGCCPECGAPWERITQRIPNGKQHKLPSGMATYEGGHGSVHRDGRELEPTYNEATEAVTTGWRPTCTCNAGDPVPCVVMDPFSGAGTVKLVAIAHGRQFIGCELNPEYIEISNRRTWSAENGGIKAPDEQQAGLFEEARER